MPWKICRLADMPACALCLREMESLDKHHLIPRTRHKNKVNQKRFSRQEAKESLLWLCRPCHKNLHTLFSNKELEREYHSLEALLAHPGVQKFTQWIQSKPASLQVRSFSKEGGL